MSSNLHRRLLTDPTALATPSAYARGCPAVSMPAVSVIMPVYNSAATVERAIRSVSAQTLRQLEIVAYDDGSRDASADILRGLAAAEPRLRLLGSDVNRGPGAARNRAIAVASGRWLAMLDADDWYAPDRLERLIRLGEATGADLVVDNQELFDEGVREVVGTALRVGNDTVPLDMDDLLNNSVTGRVQFDYGLLKPVVRRDFLTENGIRYPEQYRFGEDFLFALECFANGAAVVLSHLPLYCVGQPYGERSRVASRANRDYDFAAMKQSNDLAVERYRGRLADRQLRVLQHRGRSIDLFARYLALKRSVRQRPWRLLGLPFAPDLWPFIWRAARRRARAMGLSPASH